MKAFLNCVMLLIALLVSDAPGAEEQPTRVAILMFDKVQIIDFAGPYEVFGQAGFEVYTVSADGKPVTTVMGLSVNPSHSFASLPPVDLVLVPGGNVNEAMHNEQVQHWLKQRQLDSDHLLSVCTGSHILAEAGLLDGRQATTFHRALKGLASDYPAISVQRDKRYVDNGQIITTAGLSSGLDGALHLVARIKGMEAAKTLAMHIEYDWDPAQGFVRGLMADRLLPDNQYQWPEDSQFELLVSYGDESRWLSRYRVKTSADAKALRSAYAKAMAAHQHWQPRTSSDKGLSWVSRFEGQSWVVQFRLEKGDQPNTYELSQRIEQQQLQE